MPAKTRISKNLVLSPESDGPINAPHRILMIGVHDVVLFRLEKPFGKPFFLEKATVEHWLQNHLVKPVDFPLPPYMQPDATIPNEYQKKRDELWAVIKPVVTGVNEEIIYFQGDRWRLIEKQASITGMTPSYIYRLIQRYWLYGQIPNALLPAYFNSGGRGKVKGSSEKKRGRPRKTLISGHDTIDVGVNVSDRDREYIITSIKLYHLRQGKSLAESYEEMKDRYYTETKIINDEVVIQPLPVSQIMRLDVYRYWARIFMSDTSMHHDALGASFWRKKMKGRAGKAWQSTIGPADIFEIDATVGNFYLVSEFNRNRLIGRPVIYFVVDRRSSMIVGLHVGLEGPSWEAARFALYCAFTSKVEFCKKYGIEIQEEDWPSQEMCNIVVADNAEILSKNAERSLQNFLNIDAEINPAGIPVGKGTIESKFSTVLEKVSWVPGAWKARAEEHDKRNDLDLRWDAKLTLRELTQILIEEVLTHNNATRVEDFRTKEMIQADVLPYRKNIYLWGLENESGERVRHPDPDALHRCLLPSKLCSLTEAGLEVDGALYLPLNENLETLLASARRRRKRLRVHYDLNTDDKVFVVNENTHEWTEWRISGTSSERYARMRFEELMELRESNKFAAHDAADYENQKRFQKRQRQKAVVSQALSEKKKALPIKNKSDYLMSQSKNRAQEIEVVRAQERVAKANASQVSHQDTNSSIPNTTSRISRRNNVIALLRNRQKQSEDEK